MSTLVYEVRAVKVWFDDDNLEHAMYTRLLLAVGVALSLMQVEAGAQERPADFCKGQVVKSRKVDSEVQEQLNEALKAFEEMLAVSKSAAAPGSHWRVKLASWRTAQEAWEKTSATLPSRFQGLRRCAHPLVISRRLIEQADDLFGQAERAHDPSKPLSLIEEHEKLRKRAKEPLKQATRCYCAARNAYLKGSRGSARSRIGAECGKLRRFLYDPA